MKRYTSLLLTAFTLVLLLVLGTTYLAGSADKPAEDKPLQTLTVYTTLPAEHAAILAAEYEKINHVKINFIPLTPQTIRQKISEAAMSSQSTGDLVLTDADILRSAAADGQLFSYESEITDSVIEDFKSSDCSWTGVWYDPVVFCVNRDYLATLPRIPVTWLDLAEYNDVRIGITDFLAADASAQILFSLIENYGEEEAFALLRRMHPHIAQYSKYLSTPVRMAGMDEVDISLAVQSEALRYINEGYPLQLIYPEDGTAYTLTGAAVLPNSEKKEAAEMFLDWLLGDEAQLALQKKGFFFVPTNPATLSYKIFAGKNIVLFPHERILQEMEKHAYLDHWVKDVRLQ